MYDLLSKNGLFHRTPKKNIKHVDGLLTLSSSNKKKFSLQNSNKNRHITINIQFNHGMIRRDLFSKFIINVFEYILYDRMAIPVPFGFINRLHCFPIQSELRKKTLLNTLSRLKIVFNFISELFLKTQIHIHCVALCLGDSLRFAREIFIINLEKLIIDHNDEQNGPKRLPFLTLRYMIDSFYKRLLNEIPEEMPQLYTNNGQPKINPKNILFTLKISSENVDILRTFIENYSKEKCSDFEASNFSIQILNSTHRLGSVISRTTHFKFDHQPPDNMIANADNFDIYHDNDEFDEIIEEKIIISNDAESMMMMTDNLATNESTMLSSNIATNEIKQEYSNITQQQSMIDEMNSIWIQINPPIRCVDKI